MGNLLSDVNYDDRDHWKMCLHEAAHAVIRSHYGGGGALISEGFVSWIEGFGCDDSDTAMVHIAIAGYAAEAIVDPDGNSLETLIFKLENEFEQAFLEHGGGIESDSQFVFRVIQRTRKTGRAQTRLLYKLADETLAIVHTRWPQIESLATKVRAKLLEESGDGVYYYSGLPDTLP